MLTAFVSIAAFLAVLAVMTVVKQIKLTASAADDVLDGFMVKAAVGAIFAEASEIVDAYSVLGSGFINGDERRFLIMCVF